jgi:hypothetical protein
MVHHSILSSPPAKRAPQPPLRRWFGIVAGSLIVTFWSAGCAHDPKIVEIDHRFSINVAPTPHWFPDEETPLTPGQSEVLHHMGKPDFIRFWWNQKGRLITTSDLSGQHDQLGEKISLLKRSWIYIDDAKEIIFTKSGGGYREVPLTDVLELICEYGDPSNKTAPLLRDGQYHETWRWIEYGIQVFLIDGVEVKRTHFQATGAGTYLGK